MSKRVLVIKDQRPGHYNQSEGIVAALKKRMPVDVSYLEIESQAGISKRLVRWASKSSLPASNLLLTLAGIRPMIEKS